MLRPPLKRPSSISLVLSLIPFIGLCFSVSLWDRIEPRVAGLPFNLFWMLASLVMSFCIMSLVYRIEKRR